VPRALPSLRVGSNRSNARPTTFTTISHLSHREFAINHLILFGILWSLAISVGSAQEQPPAANAESPIGVGPAVSEAASQEKPTGATPEGGSQSRGPSRPGIDADGNGIVDQVEIDRMPSFLRDWLHKRDVSLRAGMTIDETKAAFKAAREVPAGEIRIFALKNSQATSTTDLLLQLFTAKPFRADADELHNSVVVTGSAEELQAVEALLLKLDETPRELSAKPEQDGKSAVGEDPSKTPQQQVAELRTDYETANRQAHDLAEFLRETPDAAKKAELRTAVQRAFTLRQSLLRTELLEMKARLEKTQQSLDMRDRIADQIVDRRVEDLLNPESNWEGSPRPTRVEQSAQVEGASTAVPGPSNPPAPIRLGLPEEIDAGAWGEPQNGLRLAIVVKSENSPWNKAQEVQYVVENVSTESIALRGQRNDQLAALFEVRQTSQAQVQTMPRVNSGVQETGNNVELLPGERAVIARVWIGVVEKQTDDIPEGDPQLLVIDPDAWKFQNKIYLVRGCLQPDPNQPSVTIRSGQVGIAFHKLNNTRVGSHPSSPSE